MSTDDLFTHAIQTTANWLDDFMEATGLHHRRIAFNALRASLHALRDRLPIPEVADLAAQLPMILRGAFFDGWDPAGKPLRIRHQAEFLDLVGRYMGPVPPVAPEHAVRGMFMMLQRNISPGELDQIFFSLPHEIAALWPPEQGEAPRPSA